MRETVCDYGFCDCRFSLILLGVNFQILLSSSFSIYTIQGFVMMGKALFKQLKRDFVISGFAPPFLKCLQMYLDLLRSLLSHLNPGVNRND